MHVPFALSASRTVPCLLVSRKWRLAFVLRFQISRIEWFNCSLCMHGLQLLAATGFEGSGCGFCPRAVVPLEQAGQRADGVDDCV